MAGLFLDSYDHYTTLSQKYETITSAPTISATGARNGSGLRLTSNAQAVKKNLGVNAATLYIGAYVKITSLPAAGTQDLFTTQDTGSIQNSLSISSTGLLGVYRGQHATLLVDSGANLLVAGQSYFIEWKITTHATAGRFEVLVNGVQWIVDGGGTIDTNTTANNFSNQVAIGNGSGSTALDWTIDDLYIYDGTGSKCNTFAGDCKVVALFPDGAGDSTQYTPSAGSNFQNVDETAPNDDTDYNSDATTGHKDLFTATNLPTTSGTIKCAQLIYRARKDDAGARSIKGKIKSGSTEGNGATQAQASTYAYFRDIFDTNPDTSADFTPTEINGIQIGYETVT